MMTKYRAKGISQKRAYWIHFQLLISYVHFHLDYEEFLDLVRGENSGFGRRQRQAFRQLLKQTVEFIVPYKYSYQNQYSCSPPPAFMLSISLLQAIVFVYNCIIYYKITGEVGLNGPVPHCSYLIFNPDRRYEVWRYLTYMMIHSGLFHAVFNILVQLVLGIPLEMVHGKCKDLSN